MKNKNLLKTRQEYNCKCIEKISQILVEYPQWRFTQLLFNIGLTEDRFYEEPEETLKRITSISDKWLKPEINKNSE